MTFWLLCLAFSFVLTVADLWHSGANVTEPRFVSMVLWLDWCRLIGLLTPLSLSVCPPVYSLYMWRATEGRWPMSDSAVDQHPEMQTHLSSFSSVLSTRRTRQAGERTHLQTRPPDLASPLIPLHPSHSTALPRSLQFSSRSLSLCVGAKGRASLWGQ